MVGVIGNFPEKSLPFLLRLHGDVATLGIIHFAVFGSDGFNFFLRILAKGQHG